MFFYHSVLFSILFHISLFHQTIILIFVCLVVSYNVQDIGNTWIPFKSTRMWRWCSNHLSMLPLVSPLLTQLLPVWIAFKRLLKVEMNGNDYLPDCISVPLRIWTSEHILVIINSDECHLVWKTIVVLNLVLNTWILAEMHDKIKDKNLSDLY